MLSPLFPHTYTDQTHSIRAVYNDASSKIGVMVRPVLASDAVPVENITAAEEKVFALAEVGQTFDVSQISGNPTCIGDAFVALAINILRAANLIAARTRRGAGNAAFMHPKSLAILKEISTDTFTEGNGDKSGRWIEAGMLSGVHLYVSETMAEDEVVVVYQGSLDNVLVDAPAALFRDGENFSLYVLPSTETTLGDASDYVQRIKIVHESIEALKAELTN